jgi:hypothetical protein
MLTRALKAFSFTFVAWKKVFFLPFFVCEDPSTVVVGVRTKKGRKKTFFQATNVKENALRALVSI